MTWVTAPESVPINLKMLEMKIDQYENSIDLNEAAHNELPHLNLHCLS